MSSLGYTYFIGLFISDPFIGFGYSITLILVVSNYIFSKYPFEGFVIFPHITGTFNEIFSLGFESISNTKWLSYHKNLV